MGHGGCRTQLGKGQGTDIAAAVSSVMCAHMKKSWPAACQSDPGIEILQYMLDSSRPIFSPHRVSSRPPCRRRRPVMKKPSPHLMGLSLSLNQSRRTLLPLLPPRSLPPPIFVSLHLSRAILSPSHSLLFFGLSSSHPRTHFLSLHCPQIL